MLTTDNARLIEPAEETDDKGLMPNQVILLAGLTVYLIIIAWGKISGGISTKSYEINLFNITEVSFGNIEVLVGFLIFIISVLLSVYLDKRNM